MSGLLASLVLIGGLLVVSAVIALAIGAVIYFVSRREGGR